MKKITTKTESAVQAQHRPLNAQEITYFLMVLGRSAGKEGIRLVDVARHPAAKGTPYLRLWYGVRSLAAHGKIRIERNDVGGNLRYYVTDAVTSERV